MNLSIKQQLIFFFFLLCCFSCHEMTTKESSKAQEEQEIISVDLKNTVETIIGETMSMSILMEVLLTYDNFKIHGKEPKIVQEHILKQETNMIHSYIYFTSFSDFDSVLYARKKDGCTMPLLSKEEIINEDQVRYVIKEKRKHIYKQTKGNTEQIVCIFPFFVEGDLIGFVKTISVLP
jgi:hypothetical protein